MNNTKKNIVDINSRIEQILKTAGKWDLELEVEITAKNYIQEGMEPVEAYECAFWDWVK